MMRAMLQRGGTGWPRARCARPISQRHAAGGLPLRALPLVGELAAATQALDFGEAMYFAGQRADSMVQGQLQGLSAATYPVVLLAGLLTSLSPCTLSVLPLTIGYIGGYAGGSSSSSSSGGGGGGGSTSSTSTSSGSTGSTSSGNMGSSSNSSSSSSSSSTAGGAAPAPSAAPARTAAAGVFEAEFDGDGIQPSQGSQQQQQRREPGPASGVALGIQALSFAGGLATTLAGLGVASTALGRAYGQIGDNGSLSVGVGLLAVLMGLNLLQVVQLSLPGLSMDLPESAGGLPGPVRAYLAGLVFALAASPCSSPVLVTLLAYASQADNPLQGAALLLCYTTGYVAPLLLAATFTGAVRQLLSLRVYSQYITPASGFLLVAGGTYTLISRLLPA